MKASMLLVCVLGGVMTASALDPTGEVSAARGWEAVTVLEGLEHPWALAFLPDESGALSADDMLITERGGALRLVRGGELLAEPVAGVPEVLALRQGGLLDVSLHPDFVNNGLVYLTYSSGTRSANRTTLARGRFDGERLHEVQEIFHASPDKGDGFHFGSRLVWLPDGSLLLSTGDGNNLRKAVQDLGTHIGKVLRLDDTGKAKTGNPFFARVDAVPEVYSFGHRNIQGMAIDSKTGEVWATEHGPQGGDELNRIVEGGNYGWPIITFGREYSGQTITEERHRDGMLDAHVVWTPCIGPSGLAVYRGDKFPDWDGDVFAGGLVGKQLRRVDLDAQGNVVGQEQLNFKWRIRDVRNGPDGYLYVLTDEEDGRLLRVEPK